MRRLLKKHENPQARILAERSVFGRVTSSAPPPVRQMRGRKAWLHACVAPVKHYNMQALK